MSDRIGVLVINFGEPPEPTLEGVTTFLERIFLQNAGLEPSHEAVSRAQHLARDRAPGLLEEYEAIGGSPLNRQAVEQADALEAHLRARGLDARTYSAFQFTEPGIDDAVRRAKADGVDRLVALPVYPICGRSTTVAALRDVRAALEDAEWTPPYSAVSGWHHHSAYESFRAEAIASFADERGLDCSDPETVLYFSVHGTPIRFLDDGNRYDRYVDEHCRAVANRLGLDRYAVGFQNHTNRRIAWTQPDNEDEIERRPERDLLVVPIAFMHEQSETLSELDGELRDFTEGLGKGFHRAPVPHLDPRFTDFLADLVQDLTAEGDVTHAAGSAMAPCRCAALPGVVCANGARTLPPSPFTAQPTA
ncbi:MAG: ferrochelatase [Gemmatimonadota bacterium]